MADELKKTNIKIKSSEDTGQQIKLRDQNNRTFSFFKNKKDGGPTVASQNFQKFKIGDNVEVDFKEVDYKGVTLRNVANIREATGPVETNNNQTLLNLRQPKPTREYWEKREAKRQSSILVQVAFKAALSLQHAYIAFNGKEDREKLYRDAMEFYDWLDLEIGEEQGTNPLTDNRQISNSNVTANRVLDELEF